MMPRVVSALIADTLAGAMLGAVFLAVAAYFDRTGLAQAILDLPLPLFLPVIAGALLPFAAGFAATGLDWRSAPDER
ncbi:hypothetical protein [Frigidibacter sp. SD6-1]|uniref:hypothetical protein n=1 Tax=Frigidibacter sp. SD6-1 TaxID=3032581 RepID=UPI0024E01536|nr:hypothetical protein [Frigidibacter sp. SD6-1]